MGREVPRAESAAASGAMRLILVDRGNELCDVFRREFGSHPDVQIVCGRFEDLPSFDCVVTAGNSFGLMDAGMDLAVVRFFGRWFLPNLPNLRTWVSCCGSESGLPRIRLPRIFPEKISPLSRFGRFPVLVGSCDSE